MSMSRWIRFFGKPAAGIGLIGLFLSFAGWAGPRCNDLFDFGRSTPSRHQIPSAELDLLGQIQAENPGISRDTALVLMNRMQERAGTHLEELTVRLGAPNSRTVFRLIERSDATVIAECQKRLAEDTTWEALCR